MGEAVHDKEITYPELLKGPMLRLVTAAAETGGRMNAGAHKLIRAAASSRARAEPMMMQSAICRALHTRWITMVSVAVQDAVAASLVNEGVALLEAADGPMPLPVQLWLDGRE